MLDLSAVYRNTEALPLVMAAATHWLAGALRGHPQRRSVQVIDEAWAAVRHGAAYFQASLKLSRAYGVATVLVCHRRRTSPPRPTTAPPSARSPPGCCPTSRPGCCSANPPSRSPPRPSCSTSPNANADWLGQLVQGRAIWRIGARSAVVHTVLTGNERRLFDTDQAMVAPDGPAA